MYDLRNCLVHEHKVHVCVKLCFCLSCRRNMLQLLHAALLWFYFLLPPLLCDSLLCYYSPVLEKEKIFELIVTECPPNEMCFKAVGRYGNYTALTTRGCMLEDDCSHEDSIRLKGTVYRMSYSCCGWPYCNSSPTVEPFYIIVTLVAVTVCSSWLKEQHSQPSLHPQHGVCRNRWRIPSLKTLRCAPKPCRRHFYLIFLTKQHLFIWLFFYK